MAIANINKVATIISRPNPNIVLWVLASYTAMLAATFFIL